MDLHPLEEDLLDYLDFDDFPADVKIEILGYKDAEISVNKADIEGKVHMSPEVMVVSDSEYFDFELIKDNKKWLIYDIY